MKRIIIWIASTVTIVVLLFGYHTSTNQATTAGGSTRVPGSVPTSGSGSGSSGGSPPDDPSSTAPSSGSTGNSSGSSSGNSNSSSAKKTYTGDVAQTEWGPVQVEITVKNHKITAVDLPQYPNGNPRDAQINSYAVPILVQETITAQSAKIDMVSGATVTSDGYLRSLQSALDNAGI
jgi:uncharacterized protein with FMN-binding domain